MSSPFSKITIGQNVMLSIGHHVTLWLILSLPVQGSRTYPIHEEIKQWENFRTDRKIASFVRIRS